MLAKVQETGEIIEIEKHENGTVLSTDGRTFSDHEVEIIESEKETPVMPSSVAAEILHEAMNTPNPFDNMHNEMHDQFWANKHGEIIFRLLELFKDKYEDFNTRLSNAIAYARFIVNEMKAYAAGIPLPTSEQKKDETKP
jgi:hypothetical protein